MADEPTVEIVLPVPVTLLLELLMYSSEFGMTPQAAVIELLQHDLESSEWRTLFAEGESDG